MWCVGRGGGGCRAVWCPKHPKFSMQRTCLIQRTSLYFHTLTPYASPPQAWAAPAGVVFMVFVSPSAPHHYILCTLPYTTTIPGPG